MKRRLMDVKPEPKEEEDSGLQQTVATLVAQQVATALLGPLSGGNAARFGRVAFGAQEQEGVNAFLHQKLGKDSLARRPGPGGRKLTYIESCKAIELANRAFGFNGWSCHIVECKEECKEKKGDRWSIAYSSLVRIELKDGTSHEDVGFGSSDGQRDLCAALEQAKKASISDARKRALRLFGEYLGNSCYDKDHIKDVNSNKPMAPLAAAPNVILPAQQQQPQAQNGRPPVVNRQPGNNGPVQQQNQQIQAQHVQQQRPMQQQVQAPPRQQTPSPQQMQHQPGQQMQHQQQQQRPQVPPQQAMQNQHQPQQWKPPQVLRNPPTANGSSSVQQNQGAMVNSRSSAMPAPAVNSSMATANGSSTSGGMSSTSSPFRPQPQRWVSSNAPPPSRMMASNYPPTIVKTEQPAMGQARPNAQFNMEDLSLSQFDYDPSPGNGNPAKRMRP
ncbi:hypothetical protein PR003_g12076 [Phytophthora rubi]|uniref:Rad52/22 double-strand break repair protein n=1 Tax=Phytophthora rubi TaxID=129364 RepID=A0A6A3N2A6_9STRA|nr:hypothetical protein PR001_g9197 [Phytophthora rubi]KAE9337303.1 hypothetical protein PR003_g12076 [Phytophthora rubi]